MLGRPEYWQVQHLSSFLHFIPSVPLTSLSCKFIRDHAPEADPWQSAHRLTVIWGSGEPRSAAQPTVLSLKAGSIFAKAVLWRPLQAAGTLLPAERLCAVGSARCWACMADAGMLPARRRSS